MEAGVAVPFSIHLPTKGDDLMLCDRCQAETPSDDLREHAGQNLCEDCYMDALSPAKTCDPWATYTASRLPEQTLNPRQEQIMALLRRQREATREALMDELGLPWGEVEREVAALRHMEMIRGHLKPDKSRVFRAFGDDGP